MTDLPKKKDEVDKQLEFLLTDNFQEFSEKIAEIHTEKKKKKEAFKQVYEKTQQELKQLDNQAKSIYEEFEQWKKSQASTQKLGEDQI
jgi:hypothetical protein